jgi:hypothetical protein
MDVPRVLPSDDSQPLDDAVAEPSRIACFTPAFRVFPFDSPCRIR